MLSRHAGASIQRLARMDFAGQHANWYRDHLAMNDNDQTLTQRIKDLEGAAKKVRLEAMQIAATLLTKENALLAGTRANPNHPDHKGDLAALRARYEGLVKTADDTQAMIDKLQAEEHDKKYHR
jgi:hypothetical protein